MDAVEYRLCSAEYLREHCGDRYVPKSICPENVSIATATDEGFPVAFIVLMKAQDCYDLRFLLVLPDYRRKRIATQLYNFVLSECGLGKCQVHARKFVGMDDNDMDRWLLSVGFVREELNRTCIRITSDEWMRNVNHRLDVLAGRCRGFVCKQKADLTGGDWKVIASVVRSLDRFERFAAVSDGMKDDLLVFYNDAAVLVGWMVFKWTFSHYVELDVTYILPQFRDSRCVFSFYRMATEFVVGRMPDCKGLVFYYDTFDTRLGQFYHRLLLHAEFVSLREFRYVTPLDKE